MLKRHRDQMNARAAAAGVELAADAFLFSLAEDCSTPMPPDHLTKRVAVLKGYLGIEDKHPEVVALEDEAFRLRRSTPPARSAGKPGPLPTGGMSYREIGSALGRSERWANLAVAAAERREHSRPLAGPTSTSTARSSPCGSSHPRSCWMPDSTSAWSHNGKDTDPRCSRAIIRSRVRPRTDVRPNTWVASCTARAKGRSV